MKTRVILAIASVAALSASAALSPAASAPAPPAPAPPAPAPPGNTTEDSAHAARLPRCAEKDYAYALDHNGAQGALILDAGVRYLGGPKCRVLDEVVLRLTDRRGHRLPVRGNPVRTWIGAVVGPHTANQTHPVLYAWRNWCAKTPPSYAYTLSSSAKFARYRWRISEPECVDASSPSTLRPFTNRG